MHILIAILALSLLVLIHELGHFIFAKIFKVRVNEFSIGLGPKLCGVRLGETLFALRLLPFGGACLMEGEDVDEPEECLPGEEMCPPERLFTAQKPWKRFLILVAGAGFNLLLGGIIIFGLTVGAETRVIPVIGNFGDEYAQTGVGGMQVGDEILRIDGERVYITNDISLLLDRYKEKGSHDILIRRNGEKLLLEDVVIQKGPYTYAGQSYTGYGLLLTRVDNTLGRSIAGAFETALYYARTVRYSLTDIIRGQVAFRDMSGPVGITATMSEVVRRQGMIDLLVLMAYISINLGIMNLLPIPALDGGRVVFLAVEWLLGLFKIKLSRKPEAYINAIMLLLMLGLIFMVSVNDVMRLI